MFRLKEPLSGWIGLVLLAAAASLTGCASSPSSPKLDLNNPNPNHANEVFKAERIHLEKRPKIGLALSGGGTKAAVFAHGVLHGLNDSGVLKNVDVISSVSGGSYAAMWYFTKHIEAKSFRHQSNLQRLLDGVAHQPNYRQRKTRLEPI